MKKQGCDAKWILVSKKVCDTALCMASRGKKKTSVAESCLLDGVGHSVGSQSSHHTQLLKRVFVLPFLWKLFFLWSFALNEFLPALRRAFDVTVKVLEFLRVRQRLYRTTESQRIAKPTTF